MKDIQTYERHIMLKEKFSSMLNMISNRSVKILQEFPLFSAAQITGNCHVTIAI